MYKNVDFQITILTSKDAVSLHELMLSNTEQFKRYFPKTLAKNLTLEASEKYILEKHQEIQLNSELTYAIKENRTGKIAGLIIIKKLNWETKQGEFAYCIGLEYQGKGWMSEAVSQISNYAFNELQLKTLQIISHKTNFGSIKVAKKCGFSWRKTLINEFTPTDELPLDMELYELTTR